MIVDVLSQDQRARLEAIAQAQNHIRTQSADEVLKAAQKFYDFIMNRQQPKAPNNE